MKNPALLLALTAVTLGTYLPLKYENNQVIFLQSSQTTSEMPQLNWSSMEEAIDFYEKNIIADNGKEMGEAELNMEFYERNSWQMIEESNETIVLSMNNVSIGGKDRIEFIKGQGTTEMIFYRANSPYPDRPTSKRTVRNSDYKTINSEKLNPVDPSLPPYADNPFESFTEEVTFSYLKKEKDLGEDVFARFYVYNDEQNFFEFVLVKGKTTVEEDSEFIGIYRVFEDKLIVEVPKG
ncbi:hypothetical protein [Jeotgalibaca dankookensis]|uniref:hypothetical protein n=1 Tax=Jeotgalibaca dankookensis TaxID=708126 RepID=UPI0007838FB0|nr:hypothetical protein [Jeotgalibaca dankookensis]